MAPSLHISPILTSTVPSHYFLLKASAKVTFMASQIHTPPSVTLTSAASFPSVYGSLHGPVASYFWFRDHPPPRIIFFMLTVKRRSSSWSSCFISLVRHFSCIILYGLGTKFSFIHWLQTRQRTDENERRKTTKKIRRREHHGLPNSSQLSSIHTTLVLCALYGCLFGILVSTSP